MGLRGMRLGFAKTGRYMYLCKGGATYTDDENAFLFNYHRPRWLRMGAIIIGRFGLLFDRHVADRVTKTVYTPFQVSQQTRSLDPRHSSFSTASRVSMFTLKNGGWRRPAPTI